MRGFKAESAYLAAKSWAESLSKINDAEHRVVAVTSSLAFTIGPRKDGKAECAMFVGKSCTPKRFYKFASMERAEAWRVEQVEADLRRRDHIAAQAEVRRIKAQAFVMPYKVGDVLHGSWGYDQTNCEFYEVTRIVGKRTVEIRGLKHVTVPGSEGFMCEYVTPAAGEDRFVERDTRIQDSEGRATSGSLRRVVDVNGSINLNGHCHLTKWEGGRAYSSHYA